MIYKGFQSYLKRGYQINTRMADTVNAVARRGLFYWRGSSIRDFTVFVRNCICVSGVSGVHLNTTPFLEVHHRSSTPASRSTPGLPLGMSVIRGHMHLISQMRLIGF